MSCCQVSFHLAYEFLDDTGKFWISSQDYMLCTSCLIIFFRYDTADP